MSIMTPIRARCPLFHILVLFSALLPPQICHWSTLHCRPSLLVEILLLWNTHVDALSNKHGWSLYPNHFTPPPQPQREPAQRAAYCPTNMHRNKKPLLLWWDVAVVAQHVVARYKENMYLFKRAKRAKPAPHVRRGVGKVSLPNKGCLYK